MVTKLQRPDRSTTYYTWMRILHCTVVMFFNDVCLSFGLDKCAKLSVTRGKVGLSDHDGMRYS